MKYLFAIMLCIGLALLTRNEHPSRKVETLLMCHMAVDALGDEQAKQCVIRNEPVWFDGRMPDLPPDHLVTLGNKMRERLNANSRSARHRLEHLATVWNSAECMRLHQQEAISPEQLNQLLTL
ncbi:hypothetical protein [Shimwellia blattae]|uniref:Uncharacterized protein n=1 Tax=Shimwellia blattae (strain ATCC 29907 / DSM 4481 / JCM 1650 / NBRC 105725 / CDC 9005-74) TaxID=630626 RepID=I2B8Q7_SHIBC|nr:hypothetical protein [Shimwellia blattae]AFJ46911.1 hypothetical protein EBL_c18170 [Shimwellia blattae DSM 4481 = NBRC 105725]GAB82428.1 hypothetical protein EB105725_23_00410 [Shimwellia blattae DSM 4481 = NBRC 105725]VDY64399.1 Uncharacterised protein [Shimwellia blattae]VEC22513.1 Uncharacterised protein [Shimwellia blattae]